MGMTDPEKIVLACVRKTTVRPCPFCNLPADVVIGPDGPEASCPEKNCAGHSSWIPVAKWDKRVSPDREKIRQALELLETITCSCSGLNEKSHWPDCTLGQSIALLNQVLEK